MSSMTGRLLVALIVCSVSVVPAGAQDPTLADPTVSGPASADRVATLRYANRPIVQLRAHVLSRQPAERAAAAVLALDRLVTRGVTAPVDTRRLNGTVVMSVGGEAVLVLLPADVDVLSGAT